MEMSQETQSEKRMLEREKRNSLSWGKFVKIPENGYLDLEFQLQEPNAIVTGERVFHGEVTGTYSTTFKVVQLDCDNDAVRTWEIGRKIALPIIEMLANGHKRLRIHRSGSGTSTTYTPQAL